jgi:hypothetical protein
MAGKTLSGIGEDESGKHELVVDESGPSWRLDKTPSTRNTDRSPLSTIIGAPVPSQMPVVDEDKVAEGLKRLRSLDEPLGVMPSSMPTLREGVPAVGGTPSLANPATVAAAEAAELNRSRGTAHGHALSAAGGQGNFPISVDDRMKGTLLGHSLHLPDLPGTSDGNRPAEILAISRAAGSDAIVLEPAVAGFSHGDAEFFDSDPTINPEYEPENPRGKIIARGAIFLAVVSVFVVAAIAWVRVHRPDSPPMEAHATPPAGTTPSGVDNSGASAPNAPPPNPSPAPAAAVPAEVPPPATAPGAPAGANAPTPTPRAAEVPPPSEAAPEGTEPGVIEEATPLPTPARVRSRHHEAPAPRPAASPTRTARSGGPIHETKPVVPGRRGKAQDDPDGTLPLTE